MRPSARSAWRCGARERGRRASGPATSPKATFASTRVTGPDMRRRTFMLAMGGAASSVARIARAADAPQQVFDLFAKIASALSDDDPAMFIEAVDPDMPSFQDFRRDLLALTDLATITNSIEVLSDT